MKTFLFIILAACLATITTAQTEKGTVLLGTALELGLSPASSFGGAPNVAGFSIITPKDDKESRTTAINITPKVGYFFADDFLLGVNLDFASVKEKGAESATTIIQAGPFVRYYLVLENVRPLFQAGAQFGSINFGSDDVTNLSQIGGGLGAAFFLGEQVSVDLVITYESLTAKDKDNKDNKETYNTVGLNVGFSIFLSSCLTC